MMTKVSELARTRQADVGNDDPRKGRRKVPIKRRGVPLSAGIAVLLALGACNQDASMLEMNEAWRSPHALSETTVKGVVVTADAQLDPENPGRVLLSLYLRNKTAWEVVIEWQLTPGCHFWRRAYRVENSGAEADWGGAPDGPCRLYELRTSVPARSDVAGPQLHAAYVTEVLGDSLPEGDYNFTVTVAPSGEMVELFVGTIPLTRGGGG